MKKPPEKSKAESALAPKQIHAKGRQELFNELTHIPLTSRKDQMMFITKGINDDGAQNPIALGVLANSSLNLLAFKAITNPENRAAYAAEVLHVAKHATKLLKSLQQINAQGLYELETQSEEWPILIPAEKQPARNMVETHLKTLGEKAFIKKNRKHRSLAQGTRENEVLESILISIRDKKGSLETEIFFRRNLAKESEKSINSYIKHLPADLQRILRLPPPDSLENVEEWADLVWEILQKMDISKDPSFKTWLGYSPEQGIAPEKKVYVCQKVQSLLLQAQDIKTGKKARKMASKRKMRKPLKKS